MWHEPEDRDGVLLKLFFGAFGDPEAGRRQLLDYRERVEQRLATYREIERTFDGERGTAALRRLQSLRLGIALMQASVAWAPGVSCTETGTWPSSRLCLPTPTKRSSPRPLPLPG